MTDGGSVAIKNKMLAVKTLCVDDIESLGLKEYSNAPHFLTLGRFFFANQPTSHPPDLAGDEIETETPPPSEPEIRRQILERKEKDRATHAHWDRAAVGYVDRLKHYAEQCHADHIRLLGFGGEALVFELFRKGKPLQALIRMEPGHKAQFAGSQDDPETFDDGVQIEPFAVAFNPHTAARPAYLEAIDTIAADVDQVGMHFKVMPKILNLEQIVKEAHLPDHVVDLVVTQLKDLIIAGGLDHSELMPKNIGVYLDSKRNLHMLYQDPGNMLHFHDTWQMGPEMQDERRESLIRVTPANIAEQRAQDEALRKEVAEDGKLLLAGKQTKYAREINKLERNGTLDDIVVDGWVKYVERRAALADRPALRGTDHDFDGRPTGGRF